MIVMCELAGCSLLTMNRPAPRGRDPDCVVSIAPPVADGLIAAYIALSLIAAERDPQTRRQTTIGVDLLAGGSALAFLGSGAFGLHRRSQCRSAYRDHEQYLAKRPRPSSTVQPSAPTPAPKAPPSPYGRMAAISVVVVLVTVLAAAALVEIIDQPDE